MSRWSLPAANPIRRFLAAADPRARIMLWATIAGLIFGALQFGEPLEDALRIGRNALRRHAASGDIVVVAIDDRSIAAIGRYPWPRSEHARLLDGLKRLGVRKVLFDIQFYSRTEVREDKTFQHALARFNGDVVLASRTIADPHTGRLETSLPIAGFRQHASVADVEIPLNFMGSVWWLPYGHVASSGRYPSMAATLAGEERKTGQPFLIDYAIDPRTIKTISASDVSRNSLAVGSLVGKNIIIGPTAKLVDVDYSMPGYDRMPSVYIHALGAETLNSGTPKTLSWMLPFTLSLLVAAFCLSQRILRASLLVSAVGLALLLALPMVLDARLIAMDVVPAIFLLLIVTLAWTSSSLRHSYRVRGSVNAISGLANLDSLRRGGAADGITLIAARIHNYPQIASALPAGAELTLIDQIANRLTLGSAQRKLYQGDEGVFAWFSDLPAVADVGEHLDALHGFFRNSVTVADRQIDLTLSFGIDADVGRSPANRLGSALVACDEAAAAGLRWKAYDPASLKDVDWKLSLLGQLDRAIDSGDFWVAYQAKLDLATGSICGAEALARWTHPDKGAIAPLDFILAAEQNDRIEKLTLFVLDQAIGAAVRINADGTPFNIAVNLSTRLIGDSGFAKVVEALLRKHGLAPNLLTLEVTETAALNSAGDGLETLARLRALGVKIAIDDYGTGLSTLEYLKKIPATEIKIDQSFISATTKSHSDRLMVHSTVQLAHSLGRIVVAEGVEDQATLDALVVLGCDHAQGFFIGRPMALDAFTDALLKTRRPETARLG